MDIDDKNITLITCSVCKENGIYAYKASRIVNFICDECNNENEGDAK